MEHHRSNQHHNVKQHFLDKRIAVRMDALMRAIQLGTSPSFRLAPVISAPLAANQERFLINPIRLRFQEG